MEISSKITKVREDRMRTESRIKELQVYLRSLCQKEKQLVDQEIIRQVRAMGGSGEDVLEILAKAQEILAREAEAGGKEKPAGTDKPAQQEMQMQEPSANLHGKPLEQHPETGGAETVNDDKEETDHE